MQAAVSLSNTMGHCFRQFQLPGSLGQSRSRNSIGISRWTRACQYLEFSATPYYSESPRSFFGWMPYDKGFEIRPREIFVYIHFPLSILDFGKTISQAAPNTSLPSFFLFQTIKSYIFNHVYPSTQAIAAGVVPK